MDYPERLAKKAVEQEALDIPALDDAVYAAMQSYGTQIVMNVMADSLVRAERATNDKLYKTVGRAVHELAALFEDE